MEVRGGTVVLVRSIFLLCGASLLHTANLLRSADLLRGADLLCGACPGRQRDDEPRPLADLALDTNPPFVRFDDSPRNEQAQSQPGDARRRPERRLQRDGHGPAGLPLERLGALRDQHRQRNDKKGDVHI